MSYKSEKIRNVNHYWPFSFNLSPVIILSGNVGAAAGIFEIWNAGKAKGKLNAASIYFGMSGIYLFSLSYFDASCC